MTDKATGLVFVEGDCIKIRKSDGTIVDACGGSGADYTFTAATDGVETVEGTTIDISGLADGTYEFTLKARGDAGVDSNDHGCAIAYEKRYLTVIRSGVIVSYSVPVETLIAVLDGVEDGGPEVVDCEAYIDFAIDSSDVVVRVTGEDGTLIDWAGEVMIGLALALSGGSGWGSGAVFDPTTLSASGYWRTDYSASPWAGVATAGASSGRDLSEATNPPSVGTAVNGHAPPDFDGTNDVLTGGAIGDYITSTAWEVSGLISIDAAAVAFSAGQGYAYPSILTDDGAGNFYIAIADVSGTPNLVIGHYDNVSWKEVKAPITFTTPHCFHAWFDGTNLNLIIDGGTPATPVAAGNVAVSGSNIKVGRNYTTVFLNGRVLELMTFAAVQDSTKRANLRSYYNSRYALAFP